MLLALTEHELPGQLGRQHLAVVGEVVGVRLRRRVRRRVVDQPLRRLRRLQLAADACKRTVSWVGGWARIYYLLRCVGFENRCNKVREVPILSKVLESNEYCFSVLDTALIYVGLAKWGHFTVFVRF